MNTFDFSIDRKNKTINVKREFAAPLKKVWAAWTKSDILDQWWAPKPWKAETKSMDFKNGGQWLYAMVGTNGEKHWSITDYEAVENEKCFGGLCAFTDETGKINRDMPTSNWNVSFSADENATAVNVAIVYDNVEDLEKEIEMGFEEGFSAGLSNLDELLAQHH